MQLLFRLINLVLNRHLFLLFTIFTENLKTQVVEDPIIIVKSMFTFI